MAWDGFADSTKGTSAKTRALPAIYSNRAKFDEIASKFQNDVHDLVSVSNGGDEAAVTAQLKKVAGSCGGCHKEFREK
jgi:cytochrome c556